MMPSSPGKPHARRVPKPRAAAHVRPPDGPLRLYGVHAAEAALRNPARSIVRVLATENAEKRLAPALAARGARPERASPRDLDRLLGPDTVHQGVLVEAEPLDEPRLEMVAARAQAAGPLVVLDHVTDPHNVGAVLRSCAAFGAAGLVLTRRHSPPLEGALAKSASGALEHVAVVLVQNLARALEEIRELGLLALGLDDDAEAAIETEPLSGPLALVLGAEGKGLRALTRSSCDRLARITTEGPIGSLNVSNAAAIALHLAAWRRRSA